MNTQAIFEHFTQIFSDILQDDNTNEWLLYPPIQEYHKIGDITITCGVTRCAIIDKNYDWIVKFDIEGNYCEREVELYEQAKDYGCADCLAPAIYIGRYREEENGMWWDLYAYKKAECGYRSHNTDFRAASPLTERCWSIGEDICTDWGKGMFARLSEFCEDNDINDIHSGNVGRIDGKLVLIDYAGYHDSEEDYSSEEA